MRFFSKKAFSVSVRGSARPDKETRKLLKRAEKLRSASPLHNYRPVDFGGDILQSVVSKGYVPPYSVAENLSILMEDLFTAEALAIPEVDWEHLDLKSTEGFALRDYLTRQIRFLISYQSNMRAFRDYCEWLAEVIVSHVPDLPDEDEAQLSPLTAPFIDGIPNAPRVVDTIIRSAFDSDLTDKGLLEALKKQYESNILRVSKIDPRKQHEANPHRFVMPRDMSGENARDLVDQFLGGTAVRPLLLSEIPISIPQNARFEHTHIVAGSGHGKTQLLQTFIAEDLVRAGQSKRSVVVMDSQGDLISKLKRLPIFDPLSENGVLAKRLIIIDPTDIRYPPAINMFSFDQARMSGYSDVERERVQNSAIELYEHFFGELLGAELTSKQGTVFKYLARLMLEIPNATLLTLRDLMDDPKPFIPYMEKLTGSARVFFAREFFDRSFNQTKAQVSKRLWAILSTPAFERLFSSTENKIDLFELLNSGSIILINTAKDLLKESGASLYGRFFLSMIGGAIMERAVLSADDRTPTLLYIDEAQDYFDETIELLLNQGRKYGIGLTMAHQHMDQLTTSGRASLLANTSIKLVGGVNNKDARLLASEMRTDAAFLQSQRKETSDTHFALYIRHALDQAIGVTVPLGMLEQIPTMSDESLELQLANNRREYCWAYEPTSDQIPFTLGGTAGSSSHVKPVQSETPEKAPAPEAVRQGVDRPLETAPGGKGGQRHRELQSQIKQIANELGWKAELEYRVGDGDVDVWLSTDDINIACEITVTTPIGYEVENIRKCVRSGADHVWAISDSTEKLMELARECSGIFEVEFMLPQNVKPALEKLRPPAYDRRGHMLGYEVLTRRVEISDGERSLRQEKLKAILSGEM